VLPDDDQEWNPPGFGLRLFFIVCCIGVFFAVFNMCFLRFRLRFKCSLFVVVLFSFMLFHMFH
jgi:hypothetical protein